MFNPATPRHCTTLFHTLAFALLLAPTFANAGGPKYIAGPNFFDPAALGQPIHWANGQVNYYVDQGPLSATVSNLQATAMVDDAAALWSAVPTAGVALTDKGPLNEDVNAANILVNQNSQFAQPSEVTLGATNYPLAVISGGVSYNSGSADALTLVTAPANTVPLATPIPFTVTAFAPDLTPAGGVTVIYTVTSGTATLACGLPVCSVTAAGDGHATMNITASLTNGSSLQAHFSGGTPASLTSLTPQLSLAAGATITWTVQALALSNNQPAANQIVSWQTSAFRIATKTLTVGPLAAGQTASITARVNGTSKCVIYTAFGARTQYAYLQSISGTTPEPRSRRRSRPHRPAPTRHERIPHGRRLSRPLSGPLAWTPPCSTHTVCPPSVLHATQTTAATSDLSGTVTFSPATLPGTATGTTAYLPITIQQHP